MLGTQALSRGTFQKFRRVVAVRGSWEAFLGTGVELSTGAGAGAVVEGWWVPILETSAAKPGVWILSHTLRRFGVMLGRWCWSGRVLGGAKATAGARMMTG